MSFGEGILLKKPQSVSEITNIISELIDFDLSLKNLALEGQISNLSKSSAGHYYFNLIDENALIRCVFFRGQAYRSKIELKEGDSIIVCGNVQVYKKGGTYQIIVTSVMESKESYLQKIFLELKKKLEKKGYFLPERKRPLPEKIRKIGLITSKNSAAIKDFLTTLKPRNPFIEVYLIDVRVQGETTGVEVSNAIRSFQDYDDIDLIVITRGGGSKEDLFVFNDEMICDAAFESKIPILSAVGHEIDNCLLDYTADIYCSTPTAAAQKISDAMYITVNTLPLKIKSLRTAFSVRFSYEKMLLDNLINRVESHAISGIRQDKSRLSDIDRRLDRSVIDRISNEKMRLEQSIKLLESYNVKNVLERGFAILKRDGEAIVPHSIIKKNDKIEIELNDLILHVTVDEVSRK